MKLSLVWFAAVLPACGLVQVSGPGGSTPRSSTETTSASNSGGGPSAATLAWRHAEEPQEDDLVALHAYATTTSVTPTGTVNQFADNALGLWQKHAFAKLADQCKQHVFDGEHDGTSYGKEYLHAKTMCPEILRSDDVLKNAVRMGARAFAEYELGDGYKNEMSKLEKEQHVYVDLVVHGADAQADKKRVASFVQKYYEALGETVPDDVLGRIDELVAARTKAIADAAAKGTIDKPASRDAAAERAVSETYERRYPDIRILRVWMTDPGWRIIREDGLISRRAKNAELLVRAKEGTYCAVVPASVGQAYAGGGRYASTIGVDEFTEATPVRCP